MAAAMIIFVFTHQTPPILVLSLVVMCYLAGYELWKERDLYFLWKAWWVLFVFLLNIVGFGIFWAWLAYYRHQRSRPA